MGAAVHPWSRERGLGGDSSGATSRISSSARRWPSPASTRAAGASTASAATTTTARAAPAGAATARTAASPTSWWCRGGSWCRSTSLDPRRVGPLTDAGATSYHAVKRALPKLIPGSTAVVIGAGGLGSYAVQYLRRLTGAQVIAVDLVQQRLDLARELGAHDEPDCRTTSTATRVRELTGGLGATAVFDFVGDDTTMKMALASAATLGTVAIVGAGGGTAKISWGVLPLECDFYIPMAASISDLHEVIALAETGELRVEVELFDFDDAPDAYDRFRRGDLKSRAVVTPNG